jgi:hypothetical protein
MMVFVGGATVSLRNYYIFKFESVCALVRLGVFRERRDLDGLVT